MQDLAQRLVELRGLERLHEVGGETRGLHAAAVTRPAHVGDHDELRGVEVNFPPLLGTIPPLSAAVSEALTAAHVHVLAAADRCVQRLTVVGSPDEVDRTLAQAAGAGARLVKPGKKAFWGGYSGYFADPDGFLWEVAWNPHLEIG